MPMTSSKLRVDAAPQGTTPGSWKRPPSAARTREVSELGLAYVNNDRAEAACRRTPFSKADQAFSQSLGLIKNM